MHYTQINRNWGLQAGEPSTLPGMPSQSRVVNLPHDFMIAADVSPNAKNGVNGGGYPGSLIRNTLLPKLPRNVATAITIISSAYSPVPSASLPAAGRRITHKIGKLVDSKLKRRL